MRRSRVRVAMAAAVLAGAGGTVGLIGGASADAPTYFAAGDMSVAAALSPGTTVEFWGAQWAKDNVLSGGDAPRSFKGYVDTVTFTGPCSGTFTAAPGNSSGPPASLGATVQVLVVGSVTKSGPVISGTFTDVATVSPEPGYAGNPGHAGFGTVVNGCGNPQNSQ
jgi:hypothetical protein